jgi:hypothetical protein
MRVYIILLALVLGLGLSGCQPTLNKTTGENFGADDFERGIEFANRGDYKNALRYWLPIAEHGNVKAQHNAGVLYDKGLGTGQNYAEALKWYRLAAQQGYAQSQNNLGVMYDKGNGVDVDYAQALNWYRLAAAQNFDFAQFNIGSLYENGNGVGQDYNEAKKWYRLAAEQGNASALNGLGYLSHRGLGAAKDMTQAFNFYQQAAAKNDAVAQYNLGTWYLEQKDVSNAVHWFGISANQGNKKAQVDLGEMFYKGDMILQDYPKAAKYWHMAAEQGDATAQYRIGLMYAAGNGVTKNLIEARKWLIRASVQGLADAEAALIKVTKEFCSDEPDSLECSDKGLFGVFSGIGSGAPLCMANHEIAEKLQQTLSTSLANNPLTGKIDKVELMVIAKNGDSNLSFSMASATADPAINEAITKALSQIHIKRPPPNSEYEKNHPCLALYSINLKK